MFDLRGGTPNGQRGFVHKKLFGAVKGGLGAVLSGGNPLTGAARGFISGGRTASRLPAVIPSRGAQIIPGGRSSFGSRLTNILAPSFRAPTPACNPGFERDPATGRCKRSGIVGVAERFIPGGATGFQDGATAPGFVGSGGGNAPEERQTSVAVCLKGQVLGRDGLCYGKRSIKNADRMWPRGRRPLLTSGDLNAIATASRAATRVQTQTKRLQKLGMLKSPTRRRAAPRTTAVGHHTHQAHD